MSVLGDIGQTVKGKAQQVKGDLQTQNGNGIKGGISKLKGKTNEEVGKLKLRARRNTQKKDK
jgi:uncharacterized protein YjbJ (UPF0337 family)